MARRCTSLERITFQRRGPQCNAGYWVMWLQLSGPIEDPGTALYSLDGYMDLDVGLLTRVSWYLELNVILKA
jgi:hypothetical protein